MPDGRMTNFLNLTWDLDLGTIPPPPSFFFPLQLGEGGHVTGVDGHKNDQYNVQRSTSIL